MHAELNRSNNPHDGLAYLYTFLPSHFHLSDCGNVCMKSRYFFSLSLAHTQTLVVFVCLFTFLAIGCG